MDEQREPVVPPKTAVALKYDRVKNRAPAVTASGRGPIAERILKLARENGVPVREDPDLVQLLAKLDLGQAIPGELYPIVAEVFAFVYRLNGARAGG
jgi:flagellar biosynthesis protein